MVNGLGKLLGTSLVSSDAYFVDFLPSKIEILDVLEVGCISLFMSFMATLYPAYAASKTQPVEALRYD